MQKFRKDSVKICRFVRPKGVAPDGTIRRTEMSFQNRQDFFLLRVLTNGGECGNILKPWKYPRQCGSLAQLGEHLSYKQRVTGSSPVTPTTF